MRIHKISILALTLCLGAAFARAAASPATTIDLAPYVNNSWCGDFGIYNLNCNTFPFGAQHYNGVPFLIPGNKAGTANNAWFSDFAAGGGTGVVSITIPVNVANVRTVYALMNTTWGSTQPGLLTLTFTGSAGTTWTFNPITGVDVRDWNNGPYPDTIACQLPGRAGKASAINAWVNGQGQRMDEQVYELPLAFAKQRLVSITITDSGDERVQRSFLAALTVSTALP